MLTHAQIWKAIDRLADSYGYSTSGLARRAGLDPTTFNRSKRFSSDGKERWPSTESVAKVLGITGASMGQFITLIEDGAPATPVINGKPSAAYIPCLRLDQAGDPRNFTTDGHPAGTGWADRAFPDAARQNGGPAFGIEVVGDSHAPVYRSGDIVVAAPASPVRRGDRAVVCLRRDGSIRLMEVLRQTATRVDLMPAGLDGQPVEYPVEQIAWIARIIWVSQ
jgi:phage repressor protein C with HTH and peptisase S24 domain